jgi:ABC-2 type transport system ATP-binding protein
MTDAIEIEGLTKVFNGGFKAVDDLTLNVKRNSFVGFLGPNGAGKSTTIKMLTNLISATAGKAYLGGIDVVQDPSSALSDVGVVVETPEFYPYLSPNGILEYLGRLRGMGMEEIQSRTVEVLELVKMTEESGKKIGEFSKGMKQRIAIAQALMHEPSLVILDEPTSGLDPRGMVEVREILRDLKKEDLTVFMSSHLLSEVQEICDNVAMMNHGRLILNSPVDELDTSGISRVRIRTMDPFENGGIGKIRDLGFVNDVDSHSSNEIVVEFTGHNGDRNSLLREVDRGYRVVSFSESGNPLESLYLSMIKESR